MWMGLRRSPQAAILLVCGCAVCHLALFQFNLWRRCAAQKTSQLQIAARYEPLSQFLPKDETARFVLAEDHPEKPDYFARLFMAQYAASPHRLVKDGGTRWVVVDSGRPDVATAVAGSTRWQLAADLRNGVRLYRTDVGE